MPAVIPLPSPACLMVSRAIRSTESGVDPNRRWSSRRSVAPNPERMYRVGSSVRPMPTRCAARTNAKAISPGSA